MTELTDSERIVGYRLLRTARIAESRITELAETGQISGHHSSLGHETLGVAAGLAVAPDDCVQPSHRSGPWLSYARGAVSLEELVLHQFGAGENPRIQVPGRPRTLRSIGLIGSQLPMAAGVALSYQLRGLSRTVLTFFGDGGANEGATHETLNLAAARGLPIVFVIENNGIAISTPLASASATEDLYLRAAGYGMPGEVIDGDDFDAIHASVATALARARAGGGPSLIEAKLQRPGAHAAGVRDVRGETGQDLAPDRDGVDRLRSRLISEGLWSEPQELDLEGTLVERVDQIVNQGFAPRRSEAEDDASPSTPFDPWEAWDLAHASRYGSQRIAT